MLKLEQTDSIYRLLLGLFYTPPPLPSISVTSFIFAGTIGTSSAEPRVTLANSDTTSINWILFQSASSSDSSYSTLGSGTISSPTGTDVISYLFPTTNARWYYYQVSALNSEGTTTVETSHLWNSPPATLTYVTQGFSNPGSTFAQPFVQYTVAGSFVTVTWSLYVLDAFGSPVLADSGTVAGYPTGTVTTTSNATTIPAAEYYFTVDASNAGGTDTFTTTRMLNEAT